MPHITESHFGGAVVGWFEGKYGQDAVETQEWLDEPEWYVDILVDAEWGELYIELENDADSIRPGTGQVLAYAGGEDHTVAMVVVPRGHIEEERVEWMRNGSRVIIREFDLEKYEWV